MSEATQKLADAGLKLGPWIISGVALLQVWIIALVRLLRRPAFHVFQSGNIEVGFSGFGPTIGLTGTLRVLHKDVFVKAIRLKINKRKDSSVHEFHWRAFRSSTFNLNPAEPPTFELASSFLLTTQNPFKYNIFFVDEAFAADLGAKIAPVSKKWLEFKQSKVLELQKRGDLSPFLKSQMFDEALHQEFSKAGLMTEEFIAVDRACYWEAGDYQIEMTVGLSKPNKTIVKRFQFTLSEEDAKQLRLNAVGIMRTLCGLKVTFFFAYPSYKEE